MQTAQTDILTLRMEEGAQAFFERTRQQHYPPERNQIAAHLTLFHQLPRTTAGSETVRRIAARPGFALRVTGLRSLGRGVAYVVESRELQALHGELAESFREHLTAQDRQRFMPHVVIQNKATPEQARTLLTELQTGFKPFSAVAEGLEWWQYLGGPWAPVERVDFL